MQALVILEPLYPTAGRSWQVGKSCKEILLKARALFLCRTQLFRAPLLSLLTLSVHSHPCQDSWESREEAWGNMDSCTDRETLPKTSAESPDQPYPLAMKE